MKALCGPCGGSGVCTHCKMTINHGQYRPYCAPCYYHLNPDVPCTRNYLTKQRYLYDCIKRDITTPLTSYDRKIADGCSLRKPDFFWDCLTHCVVVENDENRHISVECEDRRTMEIFQDLGNRPLVMIRFNPDNYRDNEKGLVRGCFKLDATAKLQVQEGEWKRRWRALKKEIERSLTTIPEKDVRIEYLFYGVNEEDESESEGEEEKTND